MLGRQNCLTRSPLAVVLRKSTQNTKCFKNRLYPPRGKQEDNPSEGIGSQPALLFMIELPAHRSVLLFVLSPPWNQAEKQGEGGWLCDIKLQSRFLPHCFPFYDGEHTYMYVFVWKLAYIIFVLNYKLSFTFIRQNNRINTVNNLCAFSNPIVVCVLINLAGLWVGF